MAEHEDHEFFGVRFVALGASVWEHSADQFFTCALCGATVEFSAIVDHAKFHKWVAFTYEQQMLRITTLEDALTELTGGDVIDMHQARTPASADRSPRPPVSPDR